MKYTVKNRKKITEPVLSVLAVIAILSVIIFLFIPFLSRVINDQNYVQNNRTVVFNAFPPEEIEAVLSSVTNEDGKVLKTEERIIIKYKKVRDVSFDGSTLVLEFLWDENIKLPNVTLSQWKEIESQFKEAEED